LISQPKIHYVAPSYQIQTFEPIFTVRVMDMVAWQASEVKSSY